MVLFFFRLERRRGGESCQCRLVDVLSVREESEVTLPYFSLELEAGGSGATRESLERSAFAPQPQSGVHQEGTKLTQNLHRASHSFLWGLLRSRCVTVMMFDVSLGEQCGSVLAVSK